MYHPRYVLSLLEIGAVDRGDIRSPTKKQRERNHRLCTVVERFDASQKGGEDIDRISRGIAYNYIV